MPKLPEVYDENGIRLRPDGTPWFKNPNNISAGPGMEAGQPGNYLGLKHGAQSSRILSLKASEVEDALIGVYPWIMETDRVAIAQYCSIEARRVLLDEHIWIVVERDGVEAVAPHLWSELAKAEGNAMKAADSLGLTPTGRLKIAKDAGFAQHFSSDKVGTLREQGAALRAAGRESKALPGIANTVTTKVKRARRTAGAASE